MKYISLIAAFVILLSGCSYVQENQADQPQKAIEDNIATKLEALESKDLDLYYTTITNQDEYYHNEQGRWFTEMIGGKITNLSIEVEEVVMKDENTAVATINQKHENGQQFDFTYPLLYKKEDGKWVDCGYNFEIIKTDKYTLKYMKGEPKVDEFITMIDNAYACLESVFTERPDENFEIKLFSDREMLRQRTVPSIDWLFTGWGEPNESIKLYTGHDYYGYQGTIQHELVHHITIKICNNNLSVWLLEGIAMYYGNGAYPHSQSGTLSRLDKSKAGLSIDYLESLDLYTADSEQVTNWYNASYMYATYLIDTYGHDKFMELFYEASKKPFHNSVMNDNFYAKNDETLTEVLMTVFGLTKEQLTQEYFAWLETTDFFDIDHS